MFEPPPLPDPVPIPIDAILCCLGQVMFFIGAMIALDFGWSLIAIGAMLIYAGKS